ncbi:hypothetical protein [Gemmiger sp.]|uniref:hypothetical protein n=1 Tax=Gemmiger sp. TaxID=2049027 RepID=UPI003A904008
MTVTFLTLADGFPRCTVIFFGTTTRARTSPGKSSSGAGPLPPSPANSVWGGMVTTSGSVSPPAARAALGMPPLGKSDSRATVCWPSKTCTPFSTTVCQPSSTASTL